MTHHKDTPYNNNFSNYSQTPVLLGMSGGTDSSTAAIILKNQGYDVVGVTFIFCSGNEKYIEDASNLAKQLNIKHIVYDAREAFSENILNYFISEYMSGRTPVPCIKCNNYLKWPLLASIADRLGIYYISTGHYIRIIKKESGNDNKIYVAQGNDPDKDQSFSCGDLLPKFSTE
jgi:Predicted tRNA(5-methylaminomethyl-2-thiouridylate) methyltransferase, contains the PP-loop ATPase domain